MCRCVFVWTRVFNIRWQAYTIMEWIKFMAYIICRLAWKIKWTLIVAIIFKCLCVSTKGCIFSQHFIPSWWRQLSCAIISFSLVRYLRFHPHWFARSMAASTSCSSHHHTTNWMENAIPVTQLFTWQSSIRHSAVSPFVYLHFLLFPLLAI